MKIKIKKLKEDAILPTHGHRGDAGIDFYTNENVFFKAGAQERVPTGIAVEIPDGYCGLIWDKSSISFKYGLKIMGGVIDSGFRGEIVMSLINLSDKDFTLEKGHKVAQMIIQKYEDCDILKVEELSNDTVRGEGREGSTGHK
jgi:dUTP pyrophosphatase